MSIVDVIHVVYFCIMICVTVMAWKKGWKWRALLPLAAYSVLPYIFALLLYFVFDLLPFLGIFTTIIMVVNMLWLAYMVSNKPSQL